MHLEALRGAIERSPHDARVVDEHVDARLLLQHLGAELMDALEGVHVAVLHHDLPIRLAPDLDGNVLTELGVLKKEDVQFVSSQRPSYLACFIDFS